MNYDKLKSTLKLKGLTIEEASRRIEKSRGWFPKAVKNDTLTVKDLEKLLKLCKMSIGEFFGGEPGYLQVNEPSARESELKEEVHELLKENRKLRLDIEELNGKKEPVKAKPKAY